MEMDIEKRILEGTEENPVVVSQTQWKPDGSRVEDLMNYRTGQKHTVVYDPQGKVLKSTYDCFTPQPPDGQNGNTQQSPGGLSSPKRGTDMKSKSFKWKEPRITAGAIVLLVLGIFFLRSVLSTISMYSTASSKAEEAIQSIGCLNDRAPLNVKAGEYYRVENPRILGSFAQKISTSMNSKTHTVTSRSSRDFYLMRYQDREGHTFVVSLFDPDDALKSNESYPCVYVRSVEPEEKLRSAFQESTGAPAVEKRAVFYELYGFSEEEMSQTLKSNTVMPLPFVLGSALFEAVIGGLLIYISLRKMFR